MLEQVAPVGVGLLAHHDSDIRYGSAAHLGEQDRTQALGPIDRDRH